MSKESLKKQAVKLRKTGYSYNYIKNVVGVSKGTLSVWLSGISYKPNKQTLNVIGKARFAAGKTQSRKKQESILKAEKEALCEIGNFTQRDLFMLGIGIYIGEGSKTADSVRITNSDPKIIKTGINWFTKSCGLQKNNFSIRMHLYPDSDEKECFVYWSSVTGLPKSAFLKTYVDNRPNKNTKNSGKTPFGTVHVGIKGKGSFFFRKILSWIDVVHQKSVNL